MFKLGMHQLRGSGRKLKKCWSMPRKATSPFLNLLNMRPVIRRPQHQPNMKLSLKRVPVFEESKSERTQLIFIEFERAMEVPQA